MRKRKLGPFDVSAIGLGCMTMSHGYGTPDDAESARALHRALDLGYTFFDTAALYGFGKNESLLGATLKARRGVRAREQVWDVPERGWEARDRWTAGSAEAHM
jgi:aryl-alcohol dehydrogenase-like predicted oxidoreductase